MIWTVARARRRVGPRALLAVRRRRRLRGAGGRHLAGCNVENAAYPQGQCAEATAIGVMVAAGERRIAEVVGVGRARLLCARAAAAASACRVRRPRRRASISAVPDGSAPRRSRWASCCRWRSAPTNLGRPADARRGRCRGRHPRTRRQWLPAASASCWARAWAPWPSGIADPSRSTMPICRASRVRASRAMPGKLVLGTMGGVPVACLPAARISTRASARSRSNTSSAPSRHRLPRRCC